MTKELILSCFLVIFVCCVSAELNKYPAEIVFHGTSDVSAAAILNNNSFLAADDENNILRAYNMENPDGPFAEFNLTSFLRSDPEHPEADIEGATRIGNRIYWITSHGRNKDGKLRPSRYRFFATSIKVEDSGLSIKPEGIPCTTLIHEMIKLETIKSLGIDKAAGLDMKLTKKQQQRLAPKEQGVNIEALASSPDGKKLFIGFRNPIPPNKKTDRNQALIIPLLNASEIIDKNEKPVFDEPVLLDLNGFGIRAMEYSKFHKIFFIVAGPNNSDNNFAMYRWNGKPPSPAEFVMKINTEQNQLTPEAMFMKDDSPQIFLLSDDGTIVVTVSGPEKCLPGEMLDNNKCLNKHLVIPSEKTFRLLTISPAF